PRCPALLLAGVEVDRKGRLSGPDLRAAGRPWLLARPAGLDYPRQGTFVTEALDSGLFNCVWHRLVLEADVPEGTSLTVRTHTAAAALDPERIGAVPLSRWSTPLTLVPGDLPEALLQSPPGRYLWLRLELRGDGRATPLVRALKLYAPRQSSLAYLPPVFHEDPVSADFLDRLLSFFDTVFDEVSTQIEAFSGHLDPDGVP